MPTRRFKPTTPGQRHAELADYSVLTKVKPPKSLLRPLVKKAGRNNQGKITVRRRGGGHKRLYRLIDFCRDKLGVPAKVVSLEYDPNRSAWITLLHYADGEKRYIISPVDLKVGETVIADEDAEAKPGNAMPLGKIPIGTSVYNVELSPGGGGKVARAAGTSAQIMGMDNGRVLLRLPSGEIRAFDERCMATIGQVSNPDHKNITYSKAGRLRHLGRRPKVRGVAMNPLDHPHGGGEGRSYVGRHPVASPTARILKGQKTRKKKKSEMIIKRRK
jgi:large subunit ribosomal protein L2